MIKLKSADRIKIKVDYLEFREVKGEIYRGFGINQTYRKSNNQNWYLTILEGEFKGWAIAGCRKKNDCRLLADEIIKKINKTNIEKYDFDLIRNIVKKYSVKE